MLPKYVRFALGFLCSLVLFFQFSPSDTASSNPVLEDDSEQFCVPVDLIFILGAPVEHVEWVFDAFAFQRLTRCPGSDQISRIGVVSTVPPENNGDDGFMVLPLTPMTSSTLDAWVQQREVIVSTLDRAVFVDNPRDIKEGFRAAMDLLALSPEVGSDREIMMIYVGYPATSLGADIVSAYVRDLAEQISRASVGYDSGQFSVWAILTQHHGSDQMNDTRDLNYLNQATGRNSDGERIGWDALVEQFGGKVLPDNGKYFFHEWQIDASILEAIQSVTGLAVSPFGCGEYQIDPYHGSMELLFFADNEDLKIQLSHEDLAGNVHQVQALEGDRGQLGIVFPEEDFNRYHAYLVLDPHPGAWRVGVSDGACSDMIGYRINGTPDLKVIEPEGRLLQYDIDGDWFDPEDIQNIQISLIDRVTGSPLQLWVDYPVNVTAEVTRSDGIVETLLFETGGPDFLLSEPLNVLNEGIYRWQLAVDLPFLEGSGNLSYRTAFTDISSQYDVQRVKEVVVQVMNPEQGEIVPLHAAVLPGLLRVRPLEVRIALQDRSGNDLSADDVFSDPSASVRAILVDKQTEEILSDPVFLSVSEEDESILVGSIPGTSRMKSGEYYLVLTMDGLNANQYRTAESEIKSSFNRKDSILSWPPLWYGIAGILLLLALVRVFYQVSLYLNPLHGEIHFRRHDSSRPFYVLKLNRKRKISLRNRELNRRSPILSSIREIGISRSPDDPAAKILLIVDLADGSRKKDHLSSGRSLVINSVVEAVYFDTGKSDLAAESQPAREYHVDQQGAEKEVIETSDQDSLEVEAIAEMHRITEAVADDVAGQSQDDQESQRGGSNE